jgi:hypothetical protein
VKGARIDLRPSSLVVERLSAPGAGSDLGGHVERTTGGGLQGLPLERLGQRRRSLASVAQNGDVHAAMAAQRRHVVVHLNQHGAVD